MKMVMKLLYGIVGLINFIPVIGVMGSERLASLYGITDLAPDMLLLMQHRALMFGVVGGFMLVAVFRDAWRLPASIMCAVSMAGFMILATSINHGNLALDRVFTVDLVAIVLLGAAVAIERSIAVKGRRK